MFNSFNDYNTTLFSICNQRRHQRYSTSQGTQIEVIISHQSIYTVLKGMIVDDSLGGCGLIIFAEEEKIFLKKSCFIKLKGLEPIPCKIVWHKRLDKNLFKIGLQYELDVN